MSSTWLELLRTVGYSVTDHPVERLPSAERLAEWLSSRDLAPVAAPDERDLRRARRLREALRALALAAVDGTGPDPEAVETLNRWLAASPGRLRARPAAPSITLSPPADASQALARIARAAAEDLGGPTAAHLRTCQADDCGAVFIDPSRRRRWCSSATCGNRARVRAHRSRRSASTS